MPAPGLSASLLARRSAPPQALRQHFKWFTTIAASRVSALADAVNDGRNHGPWTPDFTRESLGPLGVWFGSHVERRALNAAEQLSILARSEEHTSELQSRPPLV